MRVVVISLIISAFFSGCSQSQDRYSVRLNGSTVMIMNEHTGELSLFDGEHTQWVKLKPGQDIQITPVKKVFHKAIAQTQGKVPSSP
jgi:hypothetical protein